MKKRNLSITMTQDQLREFVQECGQNRIELRQVSTRLRKLIDDFLEHELKAIALADSSTRISSERSVYTSDKFFDLISEYVEVRGHCLVKNIEFETSMMLIDARSTLEKLRRS